ncbi:MAG: hypothetical protein ABWZ58_00490 [Acidimicrobiia bacterium]|jgi:hypothetical protein
MRRFDQGRWNRILVWTGAGLAWSSALLAGLSAPVSGESTGISGEGGTVKIGAKQAMPDPLDQGLVVIRIGRELNPPPAAPVVPTPQASGSAPEMTSSGS